MTDSIVEHALNFITSFSRGILYINRLRNKNDLSRKNFDTFFNQISNLKGEKILICGFGEVGTKLAKLLSCLEMDIYTISKTKKPSYKNFRISDLNKLLPQMNYIVNLLPLNKYTYKLFDKNKFKFMKDVFFINLGRGKTVVEKDLINAIKAGKVNSAALDVFEEEPLKEGNDLLRQERIIITPHVAGLSTNYWHEQLKLFSYNLNLFMENNNEMKNLISE
jgi:phosphoglycerate dehydrogenase-like enzyme